MPAIALQDMDARAILARDYRPSHSSLGVFQKCHARFYFERTKTKPDYTDTEALVVGKFAHCLLENSAHLGWEDPAQERAAFLKYYLEQGISDTSWYPRVHLMYKEYIKMHRVSGLGVVCCELPIGEDIPGGFVGYIDAIMHDNIGRWWICDLKTCGRWDTSLPPRLLMDPQLAAYQYYAPQICEKTGLDIKMFAGSLYRSMVKPSIVAKPQETGPLGDWQSYYSRVISDKVWTTEVDVKIPDAFVQAEKLQRDALTEGARNVLRDGCPAKNTRMCLDYMRPCPFYSKCYGMSWNDALNRMQVSTGKTMGDKNVYLD